MANGTSIKKRRVRLVHHGKQSPVHRRLALAPSRWGPLPTEILLRAIAIDRTRGILKDHPIDPVAWQRKIRTMDDHRLREQDKQWRQLPRKTKRARQRAP